jgi:hypothetical protein
LQSPLAPFAHSTIGVDSGTFIYAAKQILKGQLIYNEIVDHKGPVLYLINVVALLSCNGNLIGIWIFELFSLFATSIILYKTARLFAGRIMSLLSVITGIFSIIPLLIGGNMTEEWALPFISVALYLFISHLKENKPFTIIQLFILSLTFTLVFLIKCNLITIWGGFGIVILTKLIIKKKYFELLRCVVYVILFVILSLLPFFLYFYCNNILQDATYLIFKFNMFEYPSLSGIPMAKRFLFILMGRGYINIIPFLITIYMFYVKEDRYGGILLSFIFTAMSCTMGTNLRYYFILFCPLQVIAFAYLYNLLNIHISTIKKPVYFLIIIFSFSNANNFYKQIANISENYSSGYDTSLLSPSEMEKLTKFITANTKSTDKIIVDGLQSSIYLYSDRTCATRFPYLLVSSSLVQKYYVKEIEQSLPKVIVIHGFGFLFQQFFDISSLLNEKYRKIPLDIDRIEVWLLSESKDNK